MPVKIGSLGSEGSTFSRSDAAMRCMNMASSMSGERGEGLRKRRGRIEKEEDGERGEAETRESGVRGQ